MSTSKRTENTREVVERLNADGQGIVLDPSLRTSRHHSKSDARRVADENAAAAGQTFVVYLDSLGFIVCVDGRMQRTDVDEVYRSLPR